MTGKSRRIKQHAVWPLLLLPQAVVFLATSLRFPLLTDEALFHLPSILTFRDGLSESIPLMRLVTKYNAASGPAPYLIFWVWGTLVGFEPERLRIASLLFGMGSVIVFYLLLQHLTASQPVAYAWLLASWPYFFLYSTTLLVHSIHLFFLFAAIFAFYKGIVATRANSLWLPFGFASSALAYMTRQTSFLIVAALGTYLIVRATRLRRRQGLVAVAVSLIGCTILLTVLVVAWHGLVPPSFQRGNRVAVSQEVLFLFGISMALWFAPLAPRAFRTKNAFQIGMIVVVVALLAYLVQQAQGLGVQPLATSRGIVPFIFTLLGRPLGDIPIAVIQLSLVSIGGVVTWKIVAEQSCMLNIALEREVGNDEDELSGLLLVAAIASLPAALFTNYLFELYLMTTYALLLALSSRIRLTRFALLMWLACQTAVAVAYFYVKAYLGIS